MAILRIEEIKFKENGYEIHWSLGDPVSYIEEKPAYINYNFEPPKNFFYPLNSLFSLLIPLLLVEVDKLEIELPFQIDTGLQSYWRKYLVNIFEGEDRVLEFKSIGKNPPKISFLEVKSPTSKNGIGILFGGGVESMFCLSKLYHKSPVLISVIGERWMNNDINTAGIKFQLEEELIEKFSLNMQRIKTNLRDLIHKKDSFINRYSTGALFYFLSLPITYKFHLGYIYQVYEFEYAMNLTSYDLSISPRFVIDISIQKQNFPLYTPAFTGYSKLHMFKELAKTEFLEYIYSCFKNTEKRWCGKCGKCFRISEYCYYTGVDKNRIGMQEGIIGKRSASNWDFWMVLDKMYKKDHLHEWNLKWKYFLKKLHIGNYHK